jgi:hypothetical protein
MTLKSKILAATVIAATLAPFVPAEAQWVMVARRAAHRIHAMAEGQQGNQPGYEFASVILEAPADKVFAVAVERARKNNAIRVTMVDQTGRRLQIAEGNRTATLSVVALGDEASQLYVAATGGDATASRVVQAIMHVCMDMKKDCQVAR